MSRGTRRALALFALVTAGCGRLDYDSRPAVLGEAGPLVRVWEAPHPVELMHLTASHRDRFAIAWLDRPTMLPNELRSATLEPHDGSVATGPTLLEMGIDAKWTRLAPTSDGHLLLCPNGGSGYVVMTLDVDGSRVRSEVEGDPRYYGEGWLTSGPGGTLGVFSHDHQAEPDRYHAFFQPISADGSPMMASVVLSPETEQQRHVRGAFGGEQWVVAWQDGREALPQIRTATVSMNGTAAADRAVLPRAQEQTMPELAPDGAGSFLLTYLEAGAPRYLRIARDGTAMWPEALALPDGASSVGSAGARGLTALVWQTGLGTIELATLLEDGSLSEPRTLSPPGETCEVPAVAATDAALGVAFRCAGTTQRLYFRIIPLV